MPPSKRTAHWQATGQLGKFYPVDLVNESFSGRELPYVEQSRFYGAPRHNKKQFKIFLRYCCALSMVYVLRSSTVNFLAVCYDPQPFVDTLNRDECNSFAQILLDDF